MLLFVQYTKLLTNKKAANLKAFDWLCIKLHERKLVDYDLSRQQLELVVESISGLWVHLSCNNVVTDELPRGLWNSTRIN